MDKEVPPMITDAPFFPAPSAADWADWSELTADTDDLHRADLRSVPVCKPRTIEPWERDDIASTVRTANPYPF